MSERLIDRLSKDQINAILETLPLEFIFVDESDRLQYYNKGDKRMRKAPDNVIGQDIRVCHQPGSMARTNKMLDDFRSGAKDEDEFWMDGLGIKLLNRFLAVRDENGKYLGCLEYLLNFTAVEELAEAKKDSYRRSAVPNAEHKVEEEH